MSLLTVPVPLGDRSYDVLLGAIDVDACADRIASVAGKTSGLAVLVDGNVARACARVAPLITALSARFPHVQIRHLPDGERCKTLAELGNTCEWLADNGFDRGAIILGIGGGAATDHAGFAAAVYLRGVAFALVPTTLLAMVDASVGGKTAVDLKAGKNLVGAFHQPRVVIADLNFLDTLPAREQTAGMAEVVKAGLIGDAALFERLEKQRSTSAFLTRDDLAGVIADAVRVKIAVVSADERENNRRAILNFGHTIGHALESASGYHLLHGEAVSLGMIAALSIGVARGVTPIDLRDRATTVLSRLGLPTDVRPRLNESVLARIEVDKKRRADKVRFVLVRSPGDAVLEDLTLDEIRRLALAV